MTLCEGSGSPLEVPPARSMGAERLWAAGAPQPGSWEEQLNGTGRQAAPGRFMEGRERREPQSWSIKYEENAERSCCRSYS